MTATMSPTTVQQALATDTANMAASGQVSAATVKQLYKDGTDDIRWEARNYWLNWSFVLGEQNITWDSWRNRPDTLAVTASNRTRIVNNRLWPSCRTLVAKLLRRPLQFDVEPTQPDDASIGGARTAEAVVGDCAVDHKWEQLRRDNVWDTWLGGCAVLGLEWDPTAHQALGDTEQGDRYGLGDVREFALSIAEVATEPGCRDIETARWWIRAAALPPKEVQGLYKLAEPPKPDASAMMSPLQQKLVDAGNDQTPAAALALVLTYYERPNGSNPGQVAVVVGEQVVSRGKWPFPFTDRLNVVCTRETPMRRRWTGATVLTATRPLQRALNRAEDSIDEHMIKAGNARAVVEEGSVDLDEWDDDPASIVTVRQGSHFTPAYMSPPSMPAWWEQRPATVKADIDDMLGVHDVSRGTEAPGDAKSGIALGFLAEQDDTPLGALSKELAEGWGRFATLVLETYAAKVTDTRKAKVTASGRLPAIIEWTGKDFAGQTDVTVPQDAVAPTSRAAQFQKGLLLMDKGMFGPPGDPQTALRFAAYVDMPGASSLAVDLDPDVDKAERENHDMVTGNDVPAPADFDNHPVHIATHNRFRKSARYERLDPELQHIVEMHIQGHATMDAEEQAGQLSRAQVSPSLAAAAQPHEPPLAGDPAAVAGQGPPPPGVPASASDGGAGQTPLGAVGAPPLPSNPATGPGGP